MLGLSLHGLARHFIEERPQSSNLIDRLHRSSTEFRYSLAFFRGDLNLRAVIDRLVTDRHLEPLHYGLRLANPRLCSGLIGVVDDADRRGEPLAPRVVVYEAG